MDVGYFDASYGRLVTVEQELLDKRISNLRKIMDKNHLNILLIVQPDEGGYREWLTGTCKLDRFSEGGILIAGKGPPLLVTGSETAFKGSLEQKEAGEEFNVPTYDGKCLEHKTPYHYYEADRFDIAQMKALLGDNCRLGVVHMRQMRAVLYEKLMNLIENLQVIDVTGQAEFVKACKNCDDVRQMERLARKADRLFHGACAILRPGVYEREAVNELRNCAYELGCYGNDDGISARVSLISGETNDDDILYPGKVMEEGEKVNLAIHFIADDGCYGALARSYCLGKEPDRKIRRAWKAAVASQHAAAQLLSPGSTVRKAVGAADEVLEKYGFEDDSRIVIAGIGYGSRECPGTWNDSADWELKENMVLFLLSRVKEPGLSGVCCGDMYAVCAGGARRLNRFPQRLPIL